MAATNAAPTKASAAAPALLKGKHPELPSVFSPINVGDMKLSHRIVMGAMTRSRAPNHVPNDLQALYYSQRSTPGGLQITEGTPVSTTGHGLFTYVIKKLAKHKLAYIHLTEPVWGVGGQGPDHSESSLNQYISLVEAPTKVVRTGGYRRESTEKALSTGLTDLVGISYPFIANPDLVLRFWHNWDLAFSEPKHNYGGGQVGYTDWPTFREAQAKMVA
ncbi:hypothetical protein DFJ73DRAFT_766087 [Zopfochytrium polystomum]|nr:hypothetical protein DFJ73DRAFT_766087 [Zopfochytrium polystomum]